MGAERAGFGRRLAAALIDGLIVGIPAYVLLKILGQTHTTTSATGSSASFSTGYTGLGTILNVLIFIAYYTYFESQAAGQTLGKKVMGIRVCDLTTGQPIGLNRALFRAVGRYVSAIACLLGYLWMLWDGNKQTWHDKFATSTVVKT